MAKIIETHIVSYRGWETDTPELRKIYVLDGGSYIIERNTWTGGNKMESISEKAFQRIKANLPEYPKSNP